MSPGRPPLPPEQRKTVKRDVRFSEDEYQRLCLTAMRLRMGVSEFIRLMVLPETVNVILPREPHDQQTSLS